jgi:hypothetical protein
LFYMQDRNVIGYFQFSIGYCTKKGCLAHSVAADEAIAALYQDRFFFFWVGGWRCVVLYMNTYRRP